MRNNQAEGEKMRQNKAKKNRMDRCIKSKRKG